MTCLSHFSSLCRARPRIEPLRLTRIQRLRGLTRGEALHQSDNSLITDDLARLFILQLAILRGLGHIQYFLGPQDIVVHSPSKPARTVAFARVDDRFPSRRV